MVIESSKVKQRKTGDVAYLLNSEHYDFISELAPHKITKKHQLATAMANFLSAAYPTGVQVWMKTSPFGRDFQLISEVLKEVDEQRIPGVAQLTAIFSNLEKYVAVGLENGTIPDYQQLITDIAAALFYFPKEQLFRITDELILTKAEQPDVLRKKARLVRMFKP